MALFTTVQAGDWDDPDTWDVGGGAYPTSGASGDTAQINHDVVYNIDNSSGNTMGEINIGNNATLSFDTTQSTYLKISNTAADYCINLGSGESVEIGSSGSPLSSSYTCTIEASTSAANAYGIIDNTNDGHVFLYGSEKTISGFTTNSISASGTSFTMSSVPTDWAVGDELVILPTGSTYSETDYVSITSISGTTVNIDATTYAHSTGATVLNITRNIILKGGTNAPGNGIAAGNSTFTLEYVRIENIGTTSSTTSGCFRFGNQLVESRPIYVTGCVAYNSARTGFSPGSGTGYYQDCIAADCAYGLASQNDFGMHEFHNCYFVDCTIQGARTSTRAGVNFFDCTFAANADDGILCDNGKYLFINCKSYCNNDYGYEIISSSVDMHSCMAGESDVGTQANADADFRYYRGAFVRTNDTKMSSTTEADFSEKWGIAAVHTNYQQTANNLKIDVGRSGSQAMTIEDDTSTYRTTSPSIIFNSGISGFRVPYTIPIKVSSGDTVTASIYGKKSSATGWELDPFCRMIGCGIDDNDVFDDADILWNQKTLTGTASRDGVVVFFVFAGDGTNDFNIDDFEVSIT